MKQIVSNRAPFASTLCGSYLLISLLFIRLTVHGQQNELTEFPKKGSYLYFGQPAFEDNSFLLEEAFNQPMGVIQHIATFSLSNIKQRNVNFNFTQEIPLTDLKHQLSYSMYYSVNESAHGSKSKSGFGDMYISYRPSLMNEKQWMMLAPRFAIILPTGNASQGLGQGGWGAQVNVSITKRLSRRLITHYNLGYTLVIDADHYNGTSTEPLLTYQRTLHHKNGGIGLIWIMQRKCHLMMEYVSNFTQEIKDDGNRVIQHQGILSPGIRYCFDNGKMQIVPGIAVPITIVNQRTDVGIFFYLSIEPDYLSFYQAKER